MDEQLEPLRAQIKRVEGLPAPEFMSMRSWQRANAIATATATAAAAEVENPYYGKTEFGIEILQPGSGGADQPGMSADEEFKPFPVWMVKPGMNLTERQMRGTSGSTASSTVGEKLECQDDIKKRTVQDEYADADFGRQLGAKCKHEDGDIEEDDEIEWEEGSTWQ
jgi:transcription initiation factor TFIIE subunit alpha